MKRLLILSALLTVSATASDWKHKLYRASQFISVSTTAADCISSVGKYESNAMLRSHNGQFGTRGAVSKVAIAGGLMALQRIAERRAGQRAYLPFALVNIGYSAIGARVVYHNMSVRKVVR